MTAPALPPTGARPAITSEATAPGEPVPAKDGIKGWLAVTALVGGPLAFGMFAAFNDTGAAMLSWFVSAYSILSIGALGLSAILWITDKARKQ